jgi:hypothetical protein
VTNRWECGSSDWRVGQSCPGTPQCPPGGACCRTEGCVVLVQATCGQLWSPGACGPDVCIGACCSPQGTCMSTTQGACVGQWRGFTCTPGLCLPPGSCCSQNVCVAIVLGNGCAGQWSPGTCGPTTCTLGTCCYATSCAATLAALCPPYTWSTGGACAPNPCASPPLGVCCAFPGCTVTTQLGCPPFSDWVGWASCTPQPPQDCFVSVSTGTCCTLSGTCAVTCSNACTGTWQPFPGGYSAPCSMPMCTPPLGACCSGATCLLASSGGCPGVFSGANTACSSSGVVVCCAADFNKVGGITVQDIFDYLTAWFAGAANTDINGVDGVSVQDIFDYLNAWFAGCS